MAEVKLDILVGVRSFMDFGQLSVSHTSPVARATSDWSSPTASPTSCV